MMFKNSVGNKAPLCLDISAAFLAGCCLGHHRTEVMFLPEMFGFNDSLRMCVTLVSKQITYLS